MTMVARAILTVTLNPAVDRTLILPEVTLGIVQRVHEAHLDPAGKGINAARMVQRLGEPTLALGFLAGDVGHLVEHALRAEGVPTAFTWVQGQTRVNVALFEQDRCRGTSFYVDGPPVTAGDLTTFWDSFQSHLAHAAVLIAGGSLPRGVPVTIYAEFIAAARALAIPVILDAEGEPFHRALADGPAIVKPNRDEAARLLGRPLDDRAAIIAGAHELVARGAGAVVISLGAGGALATDGQTDWLALPPPIELRSTVGSGDSMVAGLAVALARGEALTAGLQLGTAAGAATAMVSGTALGSVQEVDELVPNVRLTCLGGGSNQARELAALVETRQER
jgi:1-phosphofructokinase